MPSAVDYVESLSPWPKDGFGLDRIKALLANLGDPQLRYPSIHVVGTNGKSTVTRTTEALLAGAGVSVGSYLSPHVRGWSERIRVRGEEADFEAAIERVRADAERLNATQFEVLTAAALAEFADAGVDVAAVEAGLGGRHDATNVLRSPVQVVTNVALEHTEVLGTTREAIAAEKLAVVQPGATVVLGEPEWEALARENGAAQVVVAGRSNLALGLAAAEAFLGRPVDGHVDVQLPGRLERLGEDRVAWLRALPAEQRVEDLVLVHAAPGDLWRAPMPGAEDDELAAVYGPLHAGAAVYGHIHRPYIRKLPVLIVANSGSVGMPWDGDPRASYLLVEDGRPQVVRVDYDVEREAALLLGSGYPDALRLADMRRRGTFIRPGASRA